MASTMQPTNNLFVGQLLWYEVYDKHGRPFTDVAVEVLQLRLDKPIVEIRPIGGHCTVWVERKELMERREA